MITEPKDPVKPEPSQIKHPSFFKRHRIIIIILISITCLLIVAAATVFIIASTAFVSVRDGCAEKDHRFQTAASSLENQLKKISINGSLPSEVKSRKNGDCLTGTGVVGTANFSGLSYANTTEANREVAKSLHAVASQDSKSFILGDDNGNDLIEFLQTELRDTVNHETYQAKYYLIDEIPCSDHEYESATCTHGEMSDNIDNYLTKPINKIELVLSKITN